MRFEGWELLCFDFCGMGMGKAAIVCFVDWRGEGRLSGRRVVVWLGSWFWRRGRLSL